MRHLPTIIATADTADTTSTPGWLDTTSTPVWLNTTAIVGFGVFLASMFALFLGLSMMGQSKKGNLKQAASQSGVSLLGLFWVALGVGGTVVSIAAATLGFFIL